MMRVAVAGGTGLVGRYVVSALTQQGYDPVVLARSTGADVVTGTGLDAALDGASAVIDVSNTTTMSGAESVAFFSAATKNLLAAGARAGIKHLVALSIVGIDRVPFGYYEGKQAQEALLLNGSAPATVLRATQFHEFADQVLARGRGPIAMIPKMRIQPVAAREVADALVDLVGGEPIGMAPELAGPEELLLVDMARQVVRARSARRLVVPVRVPGAAGRAMIDGGQLPKGGGLRGTETFAHWLRASTGAPAVSAA
jgi:uncharacterized protein YbjT (DUF2867 family)